MFEITGFDNPTMAEMARVRDAADPMAIPLDRVDIPPRKSDLAVESVGLLWV